MKQNRYFYQLSSLFLMLIGVFSISGCSTFVRSNNSSLTTATATRSIAAENGTTTPMVGTMETMTNTITATSVPTSTVVGDANNGMGNDVDGCDEGNPGNGNPCPATAMPTVIGNTNSGAMPTSTVVGNANNGVGNDLDACDEGTPCPTLATPANTNN